MLAATIHTGQLTVTERHQDETDCMLEAVAAGDRDAYERLFHHFHAKVYSFTLRMLKDSVLAQEVTSDTLFTVWTDAGRFRGQSTVSSWILGIACNKSLREIRTRKRHDLRTEAILDNDRFVGNSAFDDPEIRVGEALVLNKVERTIGQLSSDHQAVVRLTALGHTCAEIADIVGCPRNTVKTRMFHARIHLRKLLVQTESSKRVKSNSSQSSNHE